jgi:hypothetical protein
MTNAAQAFLSAGELLCLSFAAIALFYYADRLRSDLLGKPDPDLRRRRRYPK